MLDVKDQLTTLTSNLSTNSDMRMEWMNGNELYAVGMNVNRVKLNVCVQM
jgi:hypothetical protein